MKRTWLALFAATVWMSHTVTEREQVIETLRCFSSLKDVSVISESTPFGGIGWIITAPNLNLSNQECLDQPSPCRWFCTLQGTLPIPPKP